MKEFKGTPGPWEIGVADWDENGDARYSLRGVKNVCIYDYNLISSAPELLEALIHSPSTLHELPGDVECKCGQCRFVRMRNAAIAKALGE